MEDHKGFRVTISRPGRKRPVDRPNKKNMNLYRKNNSHKRRFHDRISMVINNEDNHIANQMHVIEK